MKALQYQARKNGIIRSTSVDNPTPQDLAQYIQTLKQLKELTTNSNPWIPLWSALAGGLIASILNAIGASWRGRSTRKSVEAALLTEISNISILIRKRNYLNQLKKIRSELIETNNKILSAHSDNQTTPSLEGRTFTVTVSQDYYKIYKANLDKIGVINRKKSIKIVNFYSLIESIMLDVTPTGSLGSKGYVEHYDEVIMFLEDALKLADELNAQAT